MRWWGVWITNDTKGSERRERVSCFSRFFACFVIQSTDAEIDALAYGSYEPMGEESEMVQRRS